MQAPSHRLPIQFKLALLQLQGFHFMFYSFWSMLLKKILYVDNAVNGNSSDGEIFKESNLYRALHKNVGVPAPEPLPNDDLSVHFCVWRMILLL